MTLKQRKKARAYLVRGVASEASYCGLDCTGGRVDVGLEGGGVVVGRHD